MAAALTQISGELCRGRVVDRAPGAFGEEQLDAPFEGLGLRGKRGETGIDGIEGMDDARPGKLFHGGGEQLGGGVETAQQLGLAFLPGFGGVGGGIALRGGGAGLAALLPNRAADRDRAAQHCGEQPGASACRPLGQHHRAEAGDQRHRRDGGDRDPGGETWPIEGHQAVRSCRERCAQARRARPRHASPTARASRRAATASRRTKSSARSAAPSA